MKIDDKNPILITVYNQLMVEDIYNKDDTLKDYEYIGIVNYWNFQGTYENMVIFKNKNKFMRGYIKSTGLPIWQINNLINEEEQRLDECNNYLKTKSKCSFPPYKFTTEDEDKIKVNIINHRGLLKSAMDIDLLKKELLALPQVFIIG